jgi:hypothetical protein
MERWYELALVERLDIIPLLGSLEAWRVRDGERPCTLVRSRPDIIAAHLAGKSYGSNVPAFAEDLIAIRTAERGADQLRLLEVRHVERGQIPLAIFEAYDGWPLRDVARQVTVELPVAAALALEVFRGYGQPAKTAVTGRGELVRQVLPRFENVYESEAPSYTGVEPEISMFGRIREGHELVAKMTGKALPGVPRPERIDVAEDEVAAFVTGLEELAGQMAIGPTLARLLAR